MVADAVAATRPAWLNTSPVAFVSPENAGSDQADGEGVVDDLRCDLGGLLRIALGVERLQLHLAAGVGGVVLVDGELNAVLDVDAERGVGPVERTRHCQGHRRALRLAVACRIKRLHTLGWLDLRTVLVDLDLFDDLQVATPRRAALAGLGLLLAAGYARAQPNSRYR